MKRIYLDNAATTKPDSKVIEMMSEVQEKYWGNASSIYNEGQIAKSMLEDCRKRFAFFLGCDSEEIIFTSGGTESDNLAICGFIDAVNKEQINQEAGETSKPHIITSAFEHHAVLDTIKDLEKKGLVEATHIKPNDKGLVSAKDVEKAIQDNTILVSIMYVNNEVGTVQPIAEIGKMLKTKNDELRSKSEQSSNETLKQLVNHIYFHTDAVQAIEYLETSPQYLGVDLMSIAAHKFYGPKGVGALYIKKSTPLTRQNIGGGQERKKRAGTENVAGIAGMVAAYDIIFKQRADEDIEIDGYPSGSAKSAGDQNYIEQTQILIKQLPELKLDRTTFKIWQLREKLIDGILKNIPDTKLNGDRFKRSPANANISFMNAEGESIVLMLDLAGISVSSGSACTSGSLDPSHVLLAMGLKHEEAHGSVRFTLGRNTTEKEIDRVLELLPPIIRKLREMSPIKQAFSC